MAKTLIVACLRIVVLVLRIEEMIPIKLYPPSSISIVLRIKNIYAGLKDKLKLSVARNKP